MFDRLFIHDKALRDEMHRWHLESERNIRWAAAVLLTAMVAFMGTIAKFANLY